MTNVSKIIAIVFFCLTTLGLVLFAGIFLREKKALPVLGEPGHTAGAFSFTNQHGEVFTEKNTEGKITVAEYFFTTCPGICKAMNQNLQRVYEKNRDKDDMLILSHTVNPEEDSVPVLASYARKMNVTTPQWVFLTGDKMALYKAAREDYLLAVEDAGTTGTDEDFIHTQYVSLVDKKRRIRGFYDATDSLSISKLMGDMEVLREE